MQSNAHFIQTYFVKEPFNACMLFLFLLFLFFFFNLWKEQEKGEQLGKSIIKFQRAWMSQMRKKVSDLI